MPARSRLLEFDVAVDRDRVASSALGGSPLPREDEWWAEHLVLAGLLRCTLTSLDYSARKAGLTASGSGRAHGMVTKRDSDGLYAFVEIETRLEIELEPAPERQAAEELLAHAERGCFVSNSLTAKPRHRWIVNGRKVGA
jgi:organic hydroperoxide reductase OsmC/OhrA